MATPAIHQVWRIDRFYTGASFAIIVAVFVGFAPTYYLRGYFHATALPPLVNLHGLVFTGWILLFLTQTSLVAARRIDLHRRLGVAGGVMAGVLVVLGLTTAIASARRNVAAGNAGALVFLALPFGDMLVFSILVAAAFYYRRRGDIHKRLMFLATISILGAAFARWPFAIVSNGPLAFFGATDLFIVAALVHDLISHRRLHPANVWGGLLIVASQPLRLALAGTSAWLTFASGIVG